MFPFSQCFWWLIFRFGFLLMSQQFGAKLAFCHMQGFYTHQRWLAAWRVSCPQHTCYCHLGLYLATIHQEHLFEGPKIPWRETLKKQKTSISRGVLHVLPLALALEHGNLTFADIYDGFVHAIRPTLWIAVFFCHGATKRWKFQHFGLSRAKKHRTQHCWSSYLKKKSNRFSLV